MRGAERGATAVEFALVSVLLFALVFAVIEFGRAVLLQQGVSAAGREAGRYGVATKASAGVPQYRDCAGIRAAAKQRSPDLNLADSDIVVSYELYATASASPSSSPSAAPSTVPTATATCPASGLSALPSSVPLKSGDKIVVSVRKPTDVDLPLVPLPSFTASSVNERTLWIASTP
jgi:Flp pilus assembly protein TadG